MNDTRQMRANTGNRIALGVLILLIALFIFICDCGAFGGVGEMVASVFVGFFGLADFAYCLVAAAAGVAVIFNFRVKARPGKIVKLALMFFAGVWALHVYSSSAHIIGEDYGGYLIACYDGMNTAGGMLFGIISYPLMKLITTVGALVVVCVVFFVLAFFALLPSIKKDVTYVSVAETKRERPRKGSRLDRQKGPVLTDFSAGEGGNSLYVVDVEGDPLSRGKKQSGRSGGYDPLYPNAAARQEDEQRTAPDRFSSQSLARDILFSREPSEDSFSAYRTITNPDEALMSPGAPYSAQRRNELRRRLGVDGTDSMARDFVRERYFGEERAEEKPAEKDSGNIIDPNARGAAALGYSSFDALKADRTRQFGEMLSPSSSSEDARGGFGNAPSPQQAPGTGTVRREVPKPSRGVRQHEQNKEPAAPGVSASNMAGMHGSVTRAITGEEKAQAPAAHTLPETQAYEKNDTVEAARNAVSGQAVSSARAATDRPAASGDGVPRAFRGTAASRGENEEKRTDRMFGGGYAPADRTEPPARGDEPVPRVQPETRNEAVSRTEPVRRNADEVRKEPAVPSSGMIAPDANAGSAETRRRMEEAIAKGVPKEENVDFGGDGPVIQQSIFAKQQLENIAKARATAPPLASYERIAEERAKRTYAPRENKERSLQKTENLAKKVAKESGERMAQVNIDQAISQATPKKPYVAPPLSLLRPAEKAVDQQEDYEAKKEAIRSVLESFGVQSEVKEIKVRTTSR